MTDPTTPSGGTVPASTRPDGTASARPDGTVSARPGGAEEDLLHGAAEARPEDRAAAFPLEGGALDALRARLAERAAQDGLLEVAYRTVESPIGPLLLAATTTGLVRIAFEREGFDAVLESLSTRISPRVLSAPRRLDAAATELEEYFEGRRRRFDLPLDHALSSGFRAEVQQLLPGIGYGRTRTYKEIAELAGNPRAVRAVGTACATNPLPLVVPCHRVLRSDGGLGGYLGGIEAKSTLLDLERGGPGAA